MAVPTLLVDDDDAADIGSVSEGTKPPSDVGTAKPGLLTRLLAAWPLALAVLLPLVLFTIRAMNAPLNFDGGMNLQVAERLARGEGYTRFYDGLLIFPHEVQTNGPFIYLAALSIKVFGSNLFAYQLANLVFIAGLAGVVFSMLREHVVLRVVGPLLVLVALPNVGVYGLGGLGEIPMSFFLFAAMLALAEAVRTPQRAAWWVLCAACASGAAIATKTFAVGALPALAVGGVCVLVAAPNRRVRVQAILAGAAAVLVPIGRELHRLASTGSITEYRAWWTSERTSISKQSGLESTRPGGTVQTFLDHMHVLSREHVDFPAELLVFVLFLPLLWVAGVVLWRAGTGGIRRTLSDPASVLLLMVGIFAASYLAWWLLFVPENKVWIRRIIPGLLAVQLLYLFMVPWLIHVGREAWRRARDAGTSSRVARLLPGAAVAAGVVVLGVTALPYLGGKVGGNTRSLLEGQEAWLDANQGAADYIEEHPSLRYYGDEWWSAPVVSLMADTGFYNLGDADFCTLDPARDRLVWDLDAQRVISKDPWTRSGKLVFFEVAAFGRYVTIYAVAPGPNAKCD